MAGVVCYWAGLASLSALRTDHWVLGLALFGLAYGVPVAPMPVAFLAPFVFTGVIYDSMRFYGDYIRGPVHVIEPYLYELRFFGVQTEQGLVTLNEWFATRTKPWLDLITGFFYLTFIGLFILASASIYFWYSKRGSRRRNAVWIKARAPALGWSFFWVNLLGYSTYFWYAAAPPWYVELHGFGPVKMDTQPFAAGCLRFDEMLGVNVFANMYAKSADVFGSIPSLHVSYPLILTFFAFRFGTLRIFSVVFYGMMCFSAVYLNHHYLIDVVWGSAYAILVAVLVDRYFETRASRRDEKRATQLFYAERG